MNGSSATQNLLPGPFSFPVIGNAHIMASDSKLAKLVKLEKQYGEVFRLSLGSQLAIIATGKAIKEAFVTKAADFAGRPSLYSVEIFSHGGKAKNVAIEDYFPRWRLLRKILLSALKMYTTDVPKQASLIITNSIGCCKEWN